jgi:hypothetical protein
VPKNAWLTLAANDGRNSRWFFAAMPEERHVTANPFVAIERLFALDGATEPIGTFCWVVGRMNDDSAQVMVRLLPSAMEAASLFEHEGHRFVPPVTYIEVPGADGRYGRAGPAAGPPIPSTERIPDLGDENHVWRDGRRGVIKLRLGRCFAELNAATADDAERLARRLVEMLPK